MKLQEPKVEFIELEQVVITDNSPGQETHMCGGTKFDPDPDECSQDPSLF